jgi:hypothetical protein
VGAWSCSPCPAQRGGSFLFLSPRRPRRRKDPRMRPGVALLALILADCATTSARAPKERLPTDPAPSADGGAQLAPPTVPGCSASEPCTEPATRCVHPRADALNCGPAGCREAALRCSTEADCGPGERCAASPSVPWLLCGPKPCVGPADCDSNSVCTNGRCSARACTLDSNCQGFCLSGFCSPVRGICATAAPRPSPPPAP